MGRNDLYLEERYCHRTILRIRGHAGGFLGMGISSWRYGHDSTLADETTSGLVVFSDDILPLCKFDDVNILPRDLLPSRQGQDPNYEWC